MVLTNLSQIINAGMSNPECSFWVGMSIGQISGIKLVFAFIIGGILWKAIDTLLLEPGIAFIKSKFKNKG